MVLRLMYASINYLAVYTLYSTDSVVLEDANIVGSKTKRNIYMAICTLLWKLR